MLKSYRSFTVMLLILVVAEAAFCAPKVRIMPPDRSSFAVGQWFDIRVEASGITGDSYEFKVEINGQPVDAISWARPEFTSTGAGRREVTLRRVSFDKPLQGSISATVKDSTGEASAVSTFRVVDVSGPAPKVKNVILMIGDGFGLAHRTAARIVSRGLREGRYNAPLEVDDMDAHGYTSTSSMDSLVTDSANGGTAFAGGNKTKNGSLCVWPDNTSDPTDNPRFENIISYLKRTRGLAAGVVTTDSVAGATPAAFLAYCDDRNQTAKIVAQYPDSAPEVLMGGGRNVVSASVRDKFIKAGYAYVTTAAELAALPANTTKCLGLFSGDVMETYVDRAQAQRKGSGAGLTEPSLPEMTEAAIRMLSQYPNGFILVVEGASIDKESHSKDSNRAIWEAIEFDRAVGVAKRFAASRNDTLVVVTADHETGGLTITGLSGNKLSLGWGTLTITPGEGMTEPAYTAPATGSADHTAVDVPISAFGPGASEFGKYMDATEVFFCILRAVEGGYRRPEAQPGDVNGDGKITLADVTLLLRAAVGLTTIGR
jgi:alkaline phosphatase